MEEFFRSIPAAAASPYAFAAYAIAALRWAPTSCALAADFA